MHEDHVCVCVCMITIKACTNREGKMLSRGCIDYCLVWAVPFEEWRHFIFDGILRGSKKIHWIHKKGCTHTAHAFEQEKGCRYVVVLHNRTSQGYLSCRCMQWWLCGYVGYRRWCKG